MKDAFGKTLKLGDKVIYSVGGSASTSYVIGEISKLHPTKKGTTQLYSPPDRVAVKPIKMTLNKVKPTKDPIVYASNVVKYEPE